MTFAMRRINGALIAGTLLAMVLVLGANAQEAARLSLKLEIEEAIRTGAAWLVDEQKPDGSWSDPEHPALTALPLVALKRAEQVGLLEVPTKLDAGYAYLASKAQPDGGIYVSPSIPNYNTAVSLLAFATSGDPAHEDIIRNARKRIAGWQNGESSDALGGGIGYGRAEGRTADMSNNLLALEAMYYSKRALAEDSATPAADLNWEAAIGFLQRCQNLESTNDSEWVSDDPANKGGFIYSPGSSKAGEMKLADGRTALRSYGSITYAGLLSFIYADLSRDDERVVAALDWLRGNFTLEENPGMGEQGLFYYYHTMAKALTAAGIERLDRADGTSINWKNDLAARLIGLQQSQGFWKNENARWKENDPVLTTSYALIALELIHAQL